MDMFIDNENIEKQYSKYLNNQQEDNDEIKEIFVNKKENKFKEVIIIDGYNLTVEDLVNTCDKNCKIKLNDDARKRILEARKFLEKVAAEHKSFFKRIIILNYFFKRKQEKTLMQLQLNLIRSHATGYGEPLDPAKARMLLALRINVLAKGHSGISLENLEKLINAFNAYCVSYIPEQGTVGCSGDLCPLAHLALGLLGEGKMWCPLTGWANACDVLKQNNLQPIELSYKEGLALINGTQLVSSIGALAVVRAERLAKQADVIAALTLDVLKGTTKAFDAKSHRHCGKVQDAYTLRCVPQVHGVTHDTIEFVKELLNIEINSATDNPLIFSDVEEIISGGNFHGEYPAKALDYLAIAVHELAQMSERRLERLVNHELSGLPTFLTKNGGLNSGFMTVQLCAASLVSENKVLCHPSSADSIPTSCNQEDHVSMGGFSARKALKVVEHTEAVLAMELLAACQGIEFLKPLKSTETLQKVYELVRSVAPPLNDDRYMHPEIQSVISLVRSNQIWDIVKPHLEKMSKLESYKPDLLRQEAGSPTAAVLGFPDFSRVL
ncbi:Histidine ammonia-lyase [Meloidogyne graminicola]|uniref:Histidine ammonia-lyase n=1 Tax=Meloidogyne graminicola TaxID=189291 RepID=A0A8S9ZX29_9BILA|nr:Histidine ammonia-lyase [Meloidogyne graminicola]